MTVTTLSSEVEYLGTGSQTNFPFSFKVIDGSDITVYIDGAELLVGVIVNLNADQEASPGGSVDLTPAPALDSVVLVARETPQTQQTDYDPYDPFAAETHEAALDKLTLLVQEIQTDVDEKLVWANTPATASSTGAAGQIAYDANYLYVCVATDTWVRAALTSW